MPEEEVVDPVSVEQPPALPGPFAAGDQAYCTAGNGILVDVDGRRRGRQVRIQYGNEVTVVGPSKKGNLRTTHRRKCALRHRRTSQRRCADWPGVARRLAAWNAP